jgi:hypothetical protein
MTDSLLWNIAETARQLGGMTPRTVWRLIAAEKLVPVRIGRRTFVEVQSVTALVESLRMQNNRGDNPAGAAVREGTCRDTAEEIKTGSTSGRTCRTGGRHSQMDAAVRLAAALELPSRMTRRA